MVDDTQDASGDDDVFATVGASLAKSLAPKAAPSPTGADAPGSPPAPQLPASLDAPATPTPDPIEVGLKTAGFTPDPPNPNAQQLDDRSADPNDIPSFWGDVTQAGITGAVNAAQQGIDFAKAAARKATGGTFFPNEGSDLRPGPDASTPLQPPQISPETDREVRKLLQQPFSEGYSNPRWYGAIAAAGATGMWPELLGGAVGGRLGGGLGAVAGFSATTAAMQIVPEFRKAKAEGLSDQDAVNRAITDTSIDTITAAAMGLVPGTPFVRDTVRKAVAGPITEALTHMGLIIPAVAEAGAEAKSLVDYGKVRTPDEIVTDWVGNVLPSAPIAGFHMLAGRETPASARDINVQRQQFQGVETLDFMKANVTPPDEMGFYSQVRRVVEQSGMKSAPADQWMATLTNAPGVKGEEMEWLKIPQYLADARGHVEKEDLLQHIEDNAIRVSERQLGPTDVQKEMEWSSPTRVFTDAATGKRIPAQPNGLDIAHSPSTSLFHAFTPDMDFSNYKETTFHLPPGSIEDYHEPHFNPDLRLDKMGKAIKPPATNVFAHSRTFDIFDRDGKRTRVIAEVQSELHQKGREEGYRPPGGPEIHQDLMRIATNVEDKIFRMAHLSDNAPAEVLEKVIPPDFDSVKAFRDHVSERILYESDPKKAMDKATELKIIRPEEAKIWLKVQEREQAVRSKIPDAPFKKNWSELVFKRILRMAADEGIERVALLNGDQVVRQMGGEDGVDRDGMLDASQARGIRKFYNEILPTFMKKWGRTLGMEMGETRLQKQFNDDALNERLALQGSRVMDDPKFGEPVLNLQRIKYLDLNPVAQSRIQMGFPLFMQENGVKLERQTMREAANMRPIVEKGAKAIQALAKKLGINVPLTIHMDMNYAVTHDPRVSNSVLGVLQRDQRGFHISVNLRLHENPVDVYATLAHEFGHLVHRVLFEKAPLETQLRIMLQWSKWRSETLPGATTGDVMSSRMTSVHQYYNHPAFQNGDKSMPFNEWAPEQQRYWSSFEEWMADNVAKWALTNEKPIGIGEQFLRGVGKALREIHGFFVKHFGIDASPNKFVKDWLDSEMALGEPYAANIMGAAKFNAQKASQRILDRLGYGDVTAETPTLPMLDAVTRFSDYLDDDVKKKSALTADAIFSDKFNKTREWLISLPQMAEENPNIAPLQRYREGVDLYNIKIRQDQNASLEILSGWRKLHGPSGDAAARLLDDLGNMRYLSDDEKNNEVRRMPTSDELTKMVRENKVDPNGLALVQKALMHADSKLDDAARILKQYGLVIKDPIKRNQYNMSVDAVVAREREVPYVPFMHDGDYTVEVKGAVGETKYYGRFRTKGQQMAMFRKLEATKESDEIIQAGFVNKQAKALAGIPSRLLDVIEDQLSLSDAQKAALPGLRAEQAPQISMIRRLRPKIMAPGYSADMMRSFANYNLWTSKYLARAEWAPRLRQHIADTRKVGDTQRVNKTKIDQLANYMGKHLKYVLDPTPDFAGLRSLIFALRIGFSPTTAGLYLTQTPLATYPWLAHHFGDASAIAALTRAGGRFSTYYRSTSLAKTTDVELKIQRELLKNGHLDGGLAPELAGIAENENLTANTIRGALTRGWVKYQEMGGTMLHLADSFNRRISADAATQLALANPNAKYLRRTIEANRMEYDRLVSEGWTPQEAAAYTAAVHTTKNTHFEYNRSARPQFMWGKAAAVFMFKHWTQNMLFSLWNYPGVRGRMMLMMALMAGARGLPFEKDIEDLVKVVGYRLFGKQWNPEEALREFLNEHFDSENSELLADGLLHGLSRFGMGIPWVMDQLGHHVGLPKLPTLDRSGAIGMQDILPINLNDVAGAQRDPNSVIARETESMSGAAWSTGFDMWKFMTDSKLGWDDAKAYERVIPHWMANLSKAYRWYSEGQERDRNGNPVIKFDANEPTQMMEILARGLGYSPRRLSLQYDRNSAELEAKTFWELRRTGLMRQAWDARRVNDTEEYNRVLSSIRNFNQQLAPEVRHFAISPQALLEEFRKQSAKQQAAAAGRPASKQDIPLDQKMRQLYPDVDSQGSIRVR